MSTPHDHYLENYLHQSNNQIQIEMGSDWDGGGQPYFEYNPLGYPQEESSLERNTFDSYFSPISPYSSTSSPFFPPPVSAPQTSAFNGVSIPYSRMATINEFNLNDTHYLQPQDHDPPTNDMITAGMFNSHLDDPSGVQEAFNQLINYPHGPHIPPPSISPFASPCPASISCSCMGLTRQALLNLPYIPHVGYKRTRATGPTCRRAIIERFHPEYRDLVIQILTDPEAHTPLLASLMAPLDHAGRQGFKHGCLCCPNALRCQSSQKVERHLRGLFNIRPFACRYCENTSVDIDDSKKHEKKCHLKGNSVVSPQQS